MERELVMVPSRMRGQAAALYLFVLNIIGMGLGPTSIAFVTEHIFQDPSRLGISILICTSAAHLIAALCFFSTLKPYEQTVQQINPA